MSEASETAQRRRQLRESFDSSAAKYHRARPDYPPKLIDTLIALSGVVPGDHLFEVGCGTGKATIPLAERGYSITAIELGRNLAAEAQRNLAGFGHVSVLHGAFETWESPTTGMFDLVFAATAWSWVDPEIKYQKAWDLLRRGGHLAFWTAAHILPEGGDPFFRNLQPVYDEIGEGPPPGAQSARLGELEDCTHEINASGLFQTIDVVQFDWEIAYDADAYIELLDTFSNHIAMTAPKRERLYGEIRRRLAERSDGLVRRHWGAALHVAVAVSGA